MLRKLVALLAAVVLLAMPIQALGRQGSLPQPADALNAGPANPTDESKVPHYFGPYPNWANSPFTLPDVTVTIVGNGGGAKAEAVVGANGTITDIVITDPGSGYSYANVEITGAGTGAAATAAVTSTGSVNGVVLVSGGGGYTTPLVSFSGGGAVVSVGNPLLERAYATDWLAPPTIVQESLALTGTGADVSVGSATGGTFTFSVDGVSYGPIAFDASAAAFQSALPLDFGTVTAVAGSWSVAFTAPPANLASVAIDPAGLTRPAAGAGATVDGLDATLWYLTVGDATGGTFGLTVDGTPVQGIPFDATWDVVMNLINDAGIPIDTDLPMIGDGSPGNPWQFFLTDAPTAVVLDAAGLTAPVADASAVSYSTYSANVGTAVGGTFAFVVGGSPTTALDWNANAATVQAALANSTVSGAGTVADPWLIRFSPAPGSFALDGANLVDPVNPDPINVFVVLPNPLPAGTLNEFRSWNQAAPGSSPMASAGQKFHGYVLRPTATTGTYDVVFDSGVLTVPPLADPPVSQIASYAFAGVPVLAGDLLAFYGSGIPVDTGVGADTFSYPTTVTPPAAGGQVVIGSPDYPIFPQARTYSFGGSLTLVPPNAANQATATAYGEVDNVEITFGGSGYTFPTVEFDLPDLDGGVQATGHAEMDANGTITAVVVDNRGSGYSFAPGVAIHNGTLFDPIAGATLAEATATITITEIVVTSFGSGYTAPPAVWITEGTMGGDGTGATATASIGVGLVTGITLSSGGSGYLTTGGIRKFVDTLPGLGPDGASNLDNYIPVAARDFTTFPDDPLTATNEGADYYEIAVVQFRQKMHSDLPATLMRGYVQLSRTETPFPLENELLDGTKVPLFKADGVTPYYGVDKPRFLGPTIIAARDRAVRITFFNLLPTGADGDLFLPVDTTIMGSGESNMNHDYDPSPSGSGTVTDDIRNPMCTEKYFDPAMRDMCFTENRATLHLHGGNVPWISDGTPHQWITPVGDSAMYPQGVSVQSVPDMIGPAAIAKGIPDCSAPNDGCQTFYYTNQQSARLMFYHDHSWGITRLNVYAGEAAGYLITDSTEQALFGPGGPYASLGEGIPLVVQDRTFVPDAAQLMLQDPTWDVARWGSRGSFWYHHVYMPAQNPGDPSGMSAYGRWMYGPWFWPPAGDAKNGPIANPYFNMDPNADPPFSQPLAVPCSIDDPATWQYDTDPFCEPELIPGTPNISVGMEQFNDTPIVNGVAYPTVTLEPKSYRLRMLNAANDRFFNFQWYVADASTASTGLTAGGNGIAQEVIGGTEVALKADEVAAAQLDPVVFPTPDLAKSPAGPDWIHFGSEGGFLPKPVVVDGQQVTTWITDPTRFDVGNVDQHSLLLAPAERADVIVDFSKFAGKTLILYNDAPAAFPARVPSYDYYTGAPDLRPVGAPSILPGYGPNTRTIMQVKIAGTAAPAFSVSTFQSKFSHKANGSGVFEKGQHPIIVGQAAYNSAYGKSFAASGYCSSPAATNKCDGFVRIDQQGPDAFTFDTLRMNATGTYPAGYGKLTMDLEPKAIHDEMNSSNFDEFGRMQALLGVEVVPATPGLQNVVLLPYTYSATELMDTSKLPRADVTVSPIATATDGTQIWRITHNGVDTHPIHFHATDVQVLNRVSWDNIIMPPDPTELGWKETVRISPLQDTIVAMRPAIPTLPFDFPNSIRLMSPMMPDQAPIDLSTAKEGLGLGLTAFAPNGEPVDVYNHYVNYGAEYVYHCHILSHEEMDMMRAVLFAFPPMAPTNVGFTDNFNGSATLTFVDNSRSETAFVLEKSSDGGVTWEFVNEIVHPLLPGAGSSTGDALSINDPVYTLGDTYRVFAENTIGDAWDYSDPNLNTIVQGGFPTVTVKSAYALVLDVLTPAAPSDLQAMGDPVIPLVVLSWADNASNESAYVVQRAVGNEAFATIAILGPDTTNYTDTTVEVGNQYRYQVAAANYAGNSAFAGPVTVDLALATPAAPENLAADLAGPPAAVALTWTHDGADETGFQVQRCAGVGCTDFAVIAGALPVDSIGYTDATVVAPNTYSYRVAAFNAAGLSGFSNVVTIVVAVPPAPTNANATEVHQFDFTFNWSFPQPPALQPDGFQVQVSTSNKFTTLAWVNLDVDADLRTLVISGLQQNTKYFARIRGFNAVGQGPWSNMVVVRTLR